MLDCGFNDSYCMRNNYTMKPIVSSKIMLDYGFNDSYSMRNNKTIKPIVSSNEIINNNKPSNDYYHKYIKYKVKYIKLKNSF